MKQNTEMSYLVEENAKQIAPGFSVEHGHVFCGSTDMGDLSYPLPVIQTTITGFSGAANSKDFCITDKNQAYIVPTKLMEATVIDLLADGAAKVAAVMRDNPRKEKTEYFTLWGALLK